MATVYNVTKDKEGNRVRSKAISAGDQWTDPIYLKKGGTIEVESATAGTSKINYQKRNADDTAWIDVTDADGVLYDFPPAGIFPIVPLVSGKYRAGVRTSDFSSSVGLVVTIRGK